ncbi:hypothetical protein MTO96_051850 [Rhipicephalus appendiculatus]
MPSILIDQNVLGTHKEPVSERSVLNPSGRFKWSAPESASLMPSLQKDGKRLPPESSSAIPSGLRCSTASSVASHVNTETPSVLRRPYDNQLQKASGERVIRQTKEPKSYQHSADELQQSTKCADPESSLPQETFVRSPSCVYSDVDRAPIAGTLDEIRNVMLFLESFPRTSKYCNKDSTQEAGEIHETKRAVAVTSEQAKERNVNNIQKVDLHEHATDQTRSSPKQPEPAVPVKSRGEEPTLHKAEGATAPAPTPVAHPPRVSTAASQHDGSESAPKSTGHQSPCQRLLQCLKSAVAPGHRKPIVAVITIVLLVVMVTVTWNFDYLFPSPSSDRKDPVEPLKAGGPNVTDADEAASVPLGPFEIVFTDVSILDINEEV